MYRCPDLLRVLFARHKVHAHLRAYEWLAEHFPETVPKERLEEVERWAMRNLRRINAVAERSRR